MIGLLLANALSILSAVKDLSAGGGGLLELADGDYSISAAEATEMKFYVSNHDQPEVRPVFLPLVGITNVTIRANQARIIFHGRGIGLYLHETENVRIEGITFEWADPQFTTAEIVGFAKNETLIRPRELDRVTLKDDHLCLSGEGWSVPCVWGNVFDRETHAILAGQGDVALGPIRAVGDGVYAVTNDLSKVGIGAKVGDIWLIRGYPRPHPVICLDHAVRTTLTNVTFRDGFGMGLLAQMSEDLTVENCRCTPRNTEEVGSNTVDAIHISNCRGKIRVVNSTFEGMMDDALNVHSTSLAIVDKLNDHTLRCRFMHHQAIGLDLFRSGDEIRFISGKTLENGPTAKVRSVRVHSPYDVTLVFMEPIPSGYAVGDAIENASWQCEVEFIGNTVRNNRARGVLFTTPKKVVCRGNTFDNVSGSAILLAGDAQGWYESGACQDVEISENRFINCLTSGYQYCSGLISVFPEVKDPANQKTPYHRNIRIEKNEIISSFAPLLFVKSAAEVVWRENKVDRLPQYPFIIDAASSVSME